MSEFGRPAEAPRWVSLGLIPIVNLVVAFAVAGLVVLLIGENPLLAVRFLVGGALGDLSSLSFTLYYATNFILTGLAFAVAFHCGLFNIGAEGQAYIGGLGVGLLCLALDRWLPWFLILPFAIAAGGIFGGAWAFVPGWLQAKRGSHVVITTIMFNYIAASLMVYMLVNVLIAPGQQSPESRFIVGGATLPTLTDILRWIGIPFERVPLNLSFLGALLCCWLVYVLIWRTRWGYEIRTVGFNQRAAVYGGIGPARNIMLAMALSGMLAGLVGINEIMGVQERLILNFVAGYGFVGIAVSLMGRNHPVGIILAAILFGALYQGGTVLSLEMNTITREMVVVIQGLVILFSAALENLFRGPIEAAFKRAPAAEPAPAE